MNVLVETDIYIHIDLKSRFTTTKNQQINFINLFKNDDNASRKKFVMYTAV